ncbi:unnamed protein product [Allacma fusca]|uniref:Uncharacterized protein n=1 Tax=Allacma fusca TaxID=39272 RepID=A0A8J2PR24_9HEXA|nr:unnamed protein product [Allacma fusca]
MGPYKQVFSKQPACGSSGGDDGGPDGNPPSGGKERFYLPKCQASTVPQYPDVPEGWSRCQRCSMSYLHPGQHLCSICRLRTQAGMIWQTHATMLNRKIRELEEQFRRGQWQPDGMSANTLCIGQSAGTSGLWTTASKINSSEQSFIDDEEGDRLVEKMLLDEDEDNDEEQEQVAKIKVNKEG